MTQELSGFYESLGDYYHLIFEDWDSSIYRQAKVLDFLISRELRGRPLNILDCACGIGTQARIRLVGAPRRCVRSERSHARTRVLQKRRNKKNRSSGLGLD